MWCTAFVGRPLPHPVGHASCWCTQLTNKQDIPFKVLRNGKVLGLVCPDGAVAPHSITQASGTFTYLRTEPAPAFEGTEATLPALACA